MNILKRGNPNTILFVCLSCGCIFEEEIEKCEDWHSVLKAMVKYDMGHLYFCHCPECGSLTERDRTMTLGTFK